MASAKKFLWVFSYRAWLGASIAGLCIVFLSNRFIAEGSWFTMFLAYIPQEVYVLPWIILVIGSLFARRPKRAIAPLLGCLLACLVLMGPHLHAGARSRDHLRVMSFNIQTGNQGIEKVIALIQSQQPDVFCLQECDSSPEKPVISQITAGMPEYQIESYGGMLIGSRLPILSWRTIPFPPGPPHRPLLEAVVNWQGREVRVATVHLIPVYIDHLLLENPKAIPDHLRQVGRQHEQQIDFLVRYAQAQNEPVLLCGDFNSPATGVLYQRLSSALRDSFSLAGTGFGFTIPAAFPLVRMDFIYSSKGLNPVAAWVPSQIASDHRPTVAEFAPD